MIAIDSSVLIPWINGVDDLSEVSQLEDFIRREVAVIAPITISEVLSSVSAGQREAEAISKLPRVELRPGYWERAGMLRAAVRRAGRRSAMADALIAQACIDADVVLLTRDSDFGAFAEVGGLKLA